MIDPEHLEIELDNTEFEDDIEPELEEIEQTFDPTQIRIDTRTMAIDSVLKRISHDEIDLAPDFQRHANIWTEQTQSRLIESILIRIPIPAFYMDATGDDKWLVIDGLQRLNALKKFMLDRSLCLTGLEILKELAGKTYDRLARNYQRRIEETLLTIHLIEKGTPPEVKFNIFQRINTGGQSFSPQELRHALNPGKATSFLALLANNEAFTKIVKMTERQKQRMKDIEFILGFVAFYITSYDEYSHQRGRDYFFNEAMKKINQLSEQDRVSIKDNFIRVMQAAYDIFGEYAFRKISQKNPKKYPINKALFESWTVNLSMLSDREIQLLIQYKETVKQKFIHYVDRDDFFLKSISQAANYIEYRFVIIQKIILEVLQERFTQPRMPNIRGILAKYKQRKE